MSEKKEFLLKNYFKKIISNYCLEDKNQITKFKFSELIELPLVISDRFWNIMISKSKTKEEFKIEDYSKEIEKLPKNFVVNNLINIYSLIMNNNSDFLFEFLDIDSTEVLIKSDIKFIFRNIYIHKIKTLNGFDEKLKPEINISFNNTKIILKKEFDDKFSPKLKDFIFDFLSQLNIFLNFEIIQNLCDVAFDDIHYNNKIIYLKINEEKYDNENKYSFNKKTEESDNNEVHNMTQETSDFSDSGDYINLSYRHKFDKQRKMSFSFKKIADKGNKEMKEKVTKKESTISFNWK